MGDSSAKDFSRRYARPGEFEIPNSVLESNSFKERLGGELNSDRRSPAPLGPERRVNSELSPLQGNPTLPAGEARSNAEVNQPRGNPAPPRREVRLGGELSLFRKNPAPLASEARVSVPVNRHSRKPVPPPRGERLGGELSLFRKNPAPLASEARMSAPVNRHSRKPVPPPRGIRLGGELSLFRRNAAPRSNEARLNLGLNQVRIPPAPLTSREATGSSRRVSARFELLPDPKSRWNRIGLSAVGQLAFLGLLLLSPMIFPQQMQTALRFDVVELMQPVMHIDIPPATPPPPPPPKMKPKVQPREPKPVVPKPKQVVVEPPVLNPRQPHVFLVLKPELPKLHKVETKPVDLKPVFQQTEIVVKSNQPVRPKEEVKAPNLSSGPPAPATVAAPLNKVQTGGFGDPNGIPGPGNPNKAGNINQAGSPNLPGGPGHGNGTGGAQGVRGTVASDGSNRNGAATAGASMGVSILYEPNPAYSNEARILKMEGDVVLEVVFLASSQVQVVRVVSGLGHGLDEAALQAAKLIRFKPAQRNGQPVDFPARVRIEFRLSK